MYLFVTIDWMGFQAIDWEEARYISHAHDGKKSELRRPDCHHAWPQHKHRWDWHSRGICQDFDLQRGSDAT